MKSRPIQIIRAQLLALICAAVLLPGCSAAVDLDVTLLTDIDLNAALKDYSDEELPQQGGRVGVVYRNEVDLLEEMDGKTGGGIEEVLLHEAAWRVIDNEMTSDLHDVEIMVGPFDAQSPRDPRVVVLSRVDNIPAGQEVGTTPLPMTVDGNLTFSRYLKDMQLTVFITAYVDVPPPPEAPPSGLADFEIDLIATVYTSY